MYPREVKNYTINNNVENKFSKILLNINTIEFRIKELAKEISMDYKGKDLTIINILEGSSIFTSNLLIELYNYGLTPYTGSVMIKSYNGKYRYNDTTFINMVEQKLYNNHLLFIDDIIDTGNTLNFMYRMLGENHVIKPKSINFCVLLKKIKRNRLKKEVENKCRYVGFKIPDYFVIGYGLDYNNRYRNLPYICFF